MRKRVLFVANSLDNACKFKHVLSELDVDMAAGSVVQIRKLLAPGTHIDLVIFEMGASLDDALAEIVSLVESRGCSLLVIVDESSVSNLELPDIVPCDFVMRGAGPMECSVRIGRLLGLGEKDEMDEVMTVDAMTINLATYQVTIGDDPVDFTYLEYALLSYLVGHPNRTFSRDVLLQNVWGFDYYGGSRTVDVHVRRVRAKLGPGLAQYLETVRGVGYFWRSNGQ